MANYKEYKEFIPKSFEEKNRMIQERGKKKGKLLIIMLNFILLPLNINIIKEKCLAGEINAAQDIVVEKGIAVDTIEKWLSINKIDFTNINIENGKGKITIESLSEVKNIEEAGFRVNSLKEDDKKYIVEIKY